MYRFFLKVLVPPKNRDPKQVQKYYEQDYDILMDISNPNGDYQHVIGIFRDKLTDQLKCEIPVLKSTKSTPNRMDNTGNNSNTCSAIRESTNDRLYALRANDSSCNSNYKDLSTRMTNRKHVPNIDTSYVLTEYYPKTLELILASIPPPRPLCYVIDLILKIIPPFYNLYKSGILVSDLKISSFLVTYINKPILSDFSNSIYFNKVCSNTLLLSALTTAPEVRTNQDNKIDYKRLFSWSIGWLILQMIYDPIGPSTNPTTATINTGSITTTNNNNYQILSYWPSEFQNILSSLISRKPSKRITLDLLYTRLKQIRNECELLPSCIYDPFEFNDKCDIILEDKNNNNKLYYCNRCCLELTSNYFRELFKNRVNNNYNGKSSSSSILSNTSNTSTTTPTGSSTLYPYKYIISNSDKYFDIFIKCLHMQKFCITEENVIYFYKYSLSYIVPSLNQQCLEYINLTMKNKYIYELYENKLQDTMIYSINNYLIDNSLEVLEYIEKEMIKKVKNSNKKNIEISNELVVHIMSMNGLNIPNEVCLLKHLIKFKDIFNPTQIIEILSHIQFEFIHKDDFMPILQKLELSKDYIDGIISISNGNISLSPVIINSKTYNNNNNNSYLLSPKNCDTDNSTPILSPHLPPFISNTSTTSGIVVVDVSTKILPFNFHHFVHNRKFINKEDNDMRFPINTFKCTYEWQLQLPYEEIFKVSHTPINTPIGLFFNNQLYALPFSMLNINNYITTTTSTTNNNSNISSPNKSTTSTTSSSQLQNQSSFLSFLEQIINSNNNNNNKTLIITVPECYVNGLGLLYPWFCGYNIYLSCDNVMLYLKASLELGLKRVFILTLNYLREYGTNDLELLNDLIINSNKYSFLNGEDIDILSDLFHNIYHNILFTSIYIYII